MEDWAAAPAEITSLAAAITDESDGIALTYSVLDGLVDRYELSDACFVLRPGAMGTQLFRAGRSAVLPDAAAALCELPVGLYTEPDTMDTSLRSALAGICNLSVAVQAARRQVATDNRSGLSSRKVIDAALVRAAACSARYRWPFTAALLTTEGAGPPYDRWLALCDAVRSAARVGDELGVAGPGSAWAILPNAGPDVIRPFVARVRAALSAAGADSVDLLVATATAPTDTVDPGELRRLAQERLAAARGSAEAEVAEGAEVATVDQHADPSEIELSLRELPGVVCVGRSRDGDAAGLTVVAVELSDALGAALSERLGDAVVPVNVQVVAAPMSAESDVRPPPPALHEEPYHNGGASPPVLSAPAPGGTGRMGASAGRPTLLRAEFDAARGLSEVSIKFRGVRGTGRVPAGPLAGGAQATLIALSALGVELPFYLVSAERAHGIPGAPVVVVLAPRQAADHVPLAERIGVATAADEVEASSRATLGALNRYLVKNSPDGAGNGPGDRASGSNGRLESGEKARAG